MTQIITLVNVGLQRTPCCDGEEPGLQEKKVERGWVAGQEGPVCAVYKSGSPTSTYCTAQRTLLSVMPAWMGGG